MTTQAFKFPEIGEDAIDALMWAASTNYRAGKYENAFKVYRGIVAARPEWSRAHVGMGVSLYCLGKPDEAEAAYRKALQFNGSDQEAHLYLGELIWNERKDAPAAESHLNTAFRIQPNNKFGERARYILSIIKSKKTAT